MSKSNWERISKRNIGSYFESMIVSLASRFPGHDCEGARPINVRSSLPTIRPEEIPYGLPNGWHWYRLGEICNYGTAAKAEPKDLDTTTWVLDLEDIEKESSTLLQKISLSQKDSLSTKNRFKKGDVLYSKLRPYLDKVIVADEDGVCTTEILPLSVSNEIDPYFLLLTLRRPSFLRFVNSVTRGMKMPRLGTKEGKLAVIPLPDIGTQERIVKFLFGLGANSLNGTSIDERIETGIIKLHEAQLDGTVLTAELEYQLDLVAKLRQAFLREAMQGKLVPQDPNDEPASVLLEKIKTQKAKLIAEKKIKKQKLLPDIKPEEFPFEVPPNWTWCRLGEVTNFIDYRGKTPTKISKGIKLITAKNVKFGAFSSVPEEFISESDYARFMTRGIPSNGDILFTTEAPLGNACLLHQTERFGLAQRIITIQTILFSSEFLLNSILSEVIQKQLLAKASGATAKGIKSSRLVEVLVPLPPVAEQKRIVEKLEKLMKYCDELEANIRASKQHTETLLQVALKEALEPK